MDAPAHVMNAIAEEAARSRVALQAGRKWAGGRRRGTVFMGALKLAKTEPLHGDHVAAYEAGVSARIRGEGLDDNPYLVAPHRLRAFWAAGWYGGEGRLRRMRERDMLADAEQDRVRGSVYRAGAR